MTANSLVKSRRAVTFPPMHRFAKFLMLLALTLQGFIPAMAMPMPVHDMAQGHSEDMVAEHGHATDRTQDAQSQSKRHCPLLPANCTMAFCIACTALPPLLNAYSGPSFISGTPAPALVAPMADAGLQPLVPPPRV